MKLSDLEDNKTEKEKLKLVSVEYETVTKGVEGSKNVLHLFCRDGAGRKRRIKVDGFKPYFYITDEEFKEKEEDIKQDYRFRDFDYSARSSLKNRDDVTRIYTQKPKHVGEWREDFEQTWEADVFFTNRFIIDADIYTSFKKPVGKDKISYSEIYSVDEELEIATRVVHVDIEVLSGGEMPEPRDAQKPVNAITAYDSYDEEYITWVLESENWEEKPSFENDNIHLFEDERSMLEDFNTWLGDKEPDLLTGWNSSTNDIGDGFDYPYLINRCQNLNVYSVNKWSPMSEVWCNNYGQAKVRGVELVDLMQAYMKTQVHELESKSLDFVASKELDRGKDDLENLDESYFYEPEKFVKYNRRDVEATVGIDREAEVIDLYESLREVTGAMYSDCHNNIDMIDVYFLRKSKERGLALPTSVEPDSDWYYGAFVYEPKPGLHENVLYPDLASLYPYLMKTLNVSPDTIIGKKEDLEKSQYTEEDCLVAYIDERPIKRTDSAEGIDSYKNGEYKCVYNPEKEKTYWTDDPEYTKLYYLKPEVQEGFVTSILDDLIDLKYQYSGKTYEAVKRVTNSQYGVMGDSSSYNKGFRLFDERLAETVTLAGRKVLQFTGKKFTESMSSQGYEDAYLAYGDSDSVITSIPSANSINEALIAGREAAEYTKKEYDWFMEEQFDVDEHLMDVEIESYASGIFFSRKSNDLDNRKEAAKKRYAQLTLWDEDEGFLGYVAEPKPKIKGFDCIRSDTAPITQEVQREVLRILLENDNPKDEVYSYLEKKIKEIRRGKHDEEIGVPESINQELSNYGEPNKRCIPKIRGAKYATKNIDGVNIEKGASPKTYMIKEVPEDYPQAYTADTGEHNDKVDAIAVEDVRNIPDGFQIDYEAMLEKTLKSSLEPILRTMEWNWSDVISEGRQTGLAAF